MQINHCPKTNFRENMNDWHSIRFLLIGAVATIVIASSASLFIQTSYAFDDRQSNGQQDCKSIQGKGPVEEEIIVEPVHERIEVYLTLAGWQDLGQIMEMTETVEIAETAGTMAVTVMRGQLKMELMEGQALQERSVYL